VSCREEKEVFPSITLFTPSNDVSNLNIHTSPMVMRSEKAISTFNSKVSKFQVYLLNKPSHSCGGGTTMLLCGKH
jgi:hypothetical protein